MMITASIFLLWLLGSSEQKRLGRLLGSSEQKRLGSERDSDIFLSVSLPTRPVSMGEEVTITCRNNCPWYVYLKEPSGKTDIKIDARKSEFRIPSVDRRHGGEYACCCYLYYTHYYCSEPMELLVTDPDLPSPSISLSPSRMAIQGSNVTIQCWPKDPNETMYLHKTGNGLKPQAMESNGHMAIFHIRNVSLTDGGTYCCYYRRQSEFLVSNPSVPEELWVLNPALPKPNITLTPKVVSLGGKVTIKCQSRVRADEFYLQRPGHLKLLKRPIFNGTWTQYSIGKVSKEDSGRYSCMYGVFVSQNRVLSLPSDSVTLLVTEGIVMTDIIALGVTAAVVVLFLGLGTFIWYSRRKVGFPSVRAGLGSTARRRQPTAPISVEPSFGVMKVHWKAKPDSTSANKSRQKKNQPSEQDSPAETQDIVYAELKRKGPPVQREDDSEDYSDGCIYATVVSR